MHGMKASGRAQRPLVVLFAALALAGTATAATPGRGAASIAPSQDVVALQDPHLAHARPDARARTLARVPTHTPITGQRTVLPVLARSGLWLRVRLPGRPNGHAGWITARGTASSTTPWHIFVATARRRVTVYRAGARVRSFRAVVGAAGTPTPLGQFFVEESIVLRSTDVGAPYALALSARSSVLQEFAGGPGQIALHGLDNIGGTLGSAASHGCLRLDDGAMRWLIARIGPGVPVTITR
jgi:lipoprotein-anchoring transpeptidase ErfK/SrfK